MINILLSLTAIMVLVTREIYLGRYLKLGGSGKPLLAARYALIMEALLAFLTIILLCIIAFNIN